MKRAYKLLSTCVACPLWYQIFRKSMFINMAFSSFENLKISCFVQDVRPFRTHTANRMWNLLITPYYAGTHVIYLECFAHHAGAVWRECKNTLLSSGGMCTARSTTAVYYHLLYHNTTIQSCTWPARLCRLFTRAFSVPMSRPPALIRWRYFTA